MLGEGGFCCFEILLLHGGGVFCTVFDGNGGGKVNLRAALGRGRGRGCSFPDGVLLGTGATTLTAASRVMASPAVSSAKQEKSRPFKNLLKRPKLESLANKFLRDYWCNKTTRRPNDDATTSQLPYALASNTVSSASLRVSL